MSLSWSEVPRYIHYHYEMRADGDLIDASRNGDQQAFTQIVERYQRAVYAVSFSQLRDRALADDITQDTFVTAWRHLGELRDTARLPAWLCGIARNHARDACKRRKREARGHDELPPGPVTPFDALSDVESERLVVTALERVPGVYREALVLFYYEQRSIEDVARALGISAHTTNKRLSRGRQHLAAGVDALVERRASARGPKRDLAVCVLAVIGVLGSAARVDAASAAKGSMMSKVALATVLVATVSGASYLAAKPTAKGTPARPATAHTRAPEPPRLPAASATRVVPDCDAVARHMAELQLDALDRAHRFSAQKRDQFIALRTPELAGHCTRERWADERRICVMGADDSDSARVDCVEGVVAVAGELAAVPSELRCDAVAKHVVDVMSAPGGKLAAIAKQTDKLIEELRVQEAAECDRIPWSITFRRCMVASKTQRDLGSCAR